MNTQKSNVVGTSGVLNSAMWNVIGRLAPVAVTLLAIPPLIAMLGQTRWGVMTIALTLVGTFGIFDLGLGRALTRAIAEDIGHGRTEHGADLAFTGVLALGGLGLIAAAFAGSMSGFYVDHGLKIDPVLRTETRNAIWILCATAPLVLVNAALWGIISAYQQFRAANLINIPINIFYYVGPLLALHVWNNLCAVMLALAACRLAMTVGYALIALRVMPGLGKAQPKLALLAPLWRIGGWMTLSNLTYPILTYCDRFMIGALVPAYQIAYYTTPLDVIGRFAIITSAVTGSAFPALARSFRVDVDNARDVFMHSVLAIGILLFPICFGTAMLSKPLLTLWLGPIFAEHSALISSLLCFGVLLSGIDTMASGLLDAIGRPDVNAKFSILELLVYAPLLYGSLHLLGLVGAAVIWVIRCGVDCVVRLFLASKFFPAIVPLMKRIMSLIVLYVVFIIFLLFRSGFFEDFIFAIIGMCIFFTIFWKMLMTAAERSIIVDRLVRITRWRAI